jgi:hypothetical protein
MGIELGEIKVCKITSDERGSWWSIGTKKQWMEIRVTKGGKITATKAHKTKHPVFNLEAGVKKGEGK